MQANNCESNGKEIILNGSPEWFDLSIVECSFVESLLDSDDIKLGSYLAAYEELCKFCQLMGSVFTFVLSEIRSKMDVLIELRKNDIADNFFSMKSMVKYEEESNLLHNAQYISGCRTLLRLHRGLDFLRNFLKRVGELQGNENTSGIGQEVYKETLGKYHSWLIRKGATVAMYVLPTRDVLLNRVCGDNTEIALRCLPSMLDATNDVYNRTENYFREKELLNLP